MSIWRNTLVRRLGFWALLQALPSESALKVYLKSVFLATCSAIIGSIMLGALLTVIMMVLYRIMIVYGVEEWIAALAITGFGIAVLVTFVCLFFKAIKTMTNVQNTEEVREKALKSPASRLIDAVKTGLQAGYSRN